MEDVESFFTETDLCGQVLLAQMRVSSELAKAFHVSPTKLFEEKSLAGYWVRMVLRETFGTADREKLRKMDYATFLQKFKDFDANLMDAKVNMLCGKKPKWSKTEEEERFE